MGIVLGVLGTLGKILLCLLVIVCVMALLLLFYPIKYRVEGEWREGARVQGRLHWFWFLVRLSVSYEDGFQWRIRLLGLDLMKILEGNPGNRGRKGRKKSARTGEGNSNPQEMEEDCQQSVQAEIKEEGHGESFRIGEEEERCQESVGIDEKTDSRDIQTGARETRDREVGWREENLQDSRQGRNPFKKWWRKFRQFWKWCKDFIENLRRKVGFARQMVSLLREDNTRELVCILKDNVLHLWRKLKPKVFRAHLLFGTGDPASTGEILGLFAILYAWYGDGVRIVPDFQQKVWEGDFFAKGSFSVFTLVLVFIRVFHSDEWGCFKKEYDNLIATIHGDF